MGNNKDDIPTPPDDGEVVETRDVRDKSESEVNSEIDRMLAGEAPDGDHTDALDNQPSETQTSTTDPQPQFASTDETDEELDPDDIDPAELEEQEWTLGGERGDKLIEFKGMKFLLSEPDDDELLDIIGAEPDEEVSASENMRELCQATIEAPTLTDDRWDGLNLAERLGLMMEVSQYVGLDEFMDFQDIGPEAHPGT